MKRLLSDILMYSVVFYTLHTGKPWDKILWKATSITLNLLWRPILRRWETAKVNSTQYYLLEILMSALNILSHILCLEGCPIGITWYLNIFNSSIVSSAAPISGPFDALIDYSITFDASIKKTKFGKPKKG